ncbi:hypothetical protein [Pseudoduganella sp. HUAS MS19]
MPKIELPTLGVTIGGAVVVIFDILVISGWFISGVCLLSGAYLAFNWSSQTKRRRSIAIFLIVIFVATTAGGYSVNAFISRDVMNFAVQAGTPADKFELGRMGKNGLSPLTRLHLYSYANVDGVAIAKLRAFPYKITEFDFDTKRFTTRRYD